MRSKESAEILVVYNPLAGGAMDGAQLRRLMQKHFAGRRVDFCECSDNEDMDIKLSPWLDNGVHLVIVAGGDGTISDVASALTHRDVPLGILPQGTGNVLARELEIPLGIDEAARMLAGKLTIRRLDVIRTGKSAYLLAVGVGLAATSMKETTRDQKQRFGKWAYWIPYFRNFFQSQARNYEVELDGQPMQIHASELHAVNVGIIGFKALRWGPDVLADDGIMNLCYLRARSGLDYLWFIMNFLGRRYIRGQELNCLPAHKSIHILAPAGIPVQADGDWIGTTPIEVHLEAAALKVVVPQGTN